MASVRGKNSISFKQYNRGLVLQLIATGECRTRIELVRTTKLAKMTVTNIIAEFIEQDIVVECEEEITEVCGRNPILLKISEKAPKVIGLLVFRDRIEAILCSLDMKILGTESISFDDLNEEQLLQDSYEVVDRLLQRNERVLGIGVAVIGPVDIKNGIIINPPRFYGIENVKILEALKEKYSLPIYLDHDNNSAAMAEKLFGIGKGVQDLIFLGVSNGIGSGIISNGKVFHNNQGFEPEIGHISIDRNGIQCSCGNKGCLEVYASSYVILEKLVKETGCDIEYSEFCAMKDSPEVDKIFREMVEDISVALVGSINILHPELVVLGHDCIDWDEKYVQLLETIINEKKMVHDKSRIRVRKAFFGKNAQLIGSATNLVSQVFKGEILFSTI